MNNKIKQLFNDTKELRQNILVKIEELKNEIINTNNFEKDEVIIFASENQIMFAAYVYKDEDSTQIEIEFSDICVSYGDKIVIIH